MRFELTAIGNRGVAVILPPELLAQIGMSVGDQVDVTRVDQSIVLQRIEEAERAKKLKKSLGGSSLSVEQFMKR